MEMNNIQSYSGLTINLEEVKCFKVLPKNDVSKEHNLVIEFKTRVVYVYHPGVERWVREEFKDETKVLYPDYEVAKAHMEDWEKIWQQ